MRYKIDWASLIVGSKFTVFGLFYFVYEGNFPSTSPRGAYVWRGNLTEGFLRCRFGGLIFGGAYFRNFTFCLNLKQSLIIELLWPSLYNQSCVLTFSVYKSLPEIMYLAKKNRAELIFNLNVHVDLPY